jgi:glycosyltransferase involved in cell wall biosynthesis
LESVVNQTYANKEVLIIDGGSIDTTNEIIKHYSLKFSFIKWKSEIDDGIYDAMNKGIYLATGDWIYFLGSDDVFYKENVLESIFTLPFYGNLEVIYGDIMSTRFGGVYGGEFSFKRIVNQNISHQGLFTKKTLFDKIGKFDIQYKAHADWDFNMRWFLDHTVERRYVNIIIAEYADGGYSSLHGDPIFEHDRKVKLIKYGHKTLPDHILRQLYEDVFMEGIERKTPLRCFKYIKGIMQYSNKRKLFLKRLIHALFDNLLKTAYA